uniref:hypothetical protein n=1 Tax=Horticoccus sp. 23ND18S-11 TaxID=3391832 RepID=UPI0039C909AE
MQKSNSTDRPQTEPLSAAAEPAPRSRLWLWFVALFVVQLGVWTAWIIIASNHRVAEVPLVHRSAR